MSLSVLGYHLRENRPSIEIESKLKYSDAMMLLIASKLKAENFFHGFKSNEGSCISHALHNLCLGLRVTVLGVARLCLSSAAEHLEQGDKRTPHEFSTMMSVAPVVFK